MRVEKTELSVLVINTVEFKKGGMSTVIMNYFENIDKSRIHMDFVVNRRIEEEYKNELEANGSKVYLLERNAEPVKYFFRLLAIISKKKYDIVHVHGNSCTMAIELIAAMFCGCKRRIAHSHNSTCDHKTIHRLLKHLFEISCTDCLACSIEAGEWLFRGKEYTIVENALNLELYRFDIERRKDIRKRIQVEETDILLGHVGHFNEQKNHRFIVDIFNKLHTDGLPYKLILVGEGDEKEETERYVRQKNLENLVFFYGITRDIAGVMSAMDIFLFPSKWEGLGIVMLEAQLTGLPCIASKAVPEATRISDNCEYLELSAPLEIWCDAVRKMHNRKVNRLEVEISREGKKRFDIKEQVGKLENIYFRKSKYNFLKTQI